jgi:branched-chain amino acid aminotransferase
MKVFLNGELLASDAARVPVSDRGFLVGDGVFETLRAYRGIAFALEQHLERLAHSARVMEVELPDLRDLASAVERTIAGNALSDARVRITVTSGSGPAGLARDSGFPTVLVTAVPLPSWPEVARVVISPWPRNERSVLADIKTTSNAENVAKLVHARGKGADEAISLNLAGNVCEGTSSNVFAVVRGRVATPPLAAGCLAGITRDRLIALGDDAGAEIAERDISLEELRASDELFLTSSTREVQPVVALDDEPIGAGAPGPVTRRLAAAFSEMVRGEVG